MKNKNLVALCAIVTTLFSSCATGNYNRGASYQLAPASGNGLLVRTISYEVPEGESNYQPPIRPSIKVSAIFEEGDSFGARYKKAGLKPSDAIGWSVIKGNRGVYTIAEEWPAGNYTLTPQATAYSGSIVRVSSFKPRKVTITGGQIVYAGDFQFSSLKNGAGGISTFLTGTKVDRNCCVVVVDESARDLALLNDKVPNVVGNRKVKDIRKPTE